MSDKRVMTFASITLTKGKVKLLGYLMENNTFQFIIGGKKMQTFASLLDVWEAWEDINEDIN